MSRIYVASSVPAAVLFGCAALAQEASPSSPAAKGSAKPVKERRICRSETTTGSMLSRSVCHTAAEWKAIEVANQEQIERARNSSTAGQPR